MKKTGFDKIVEQAEEHPRIDTGEECLLLQELCDLQKETINSFRLINEKIKFSALNVVLLQGLTQSKAFWEEINQIILIHLGESKVLNSLTEKTHNTNSHLLTEIEKQDMISLIENIKLFEEFTISYY